ncbi:MAG: Gfo/Idh/MocA family oxidoreductase [Planctomycetaceae bacterium]|jgi:predicted dehydrogenase|nr:Gfo/Idh/MocA family oxidoreductase [Planctomycetaceae bacterium]
MLKIGIIGAGRLGSFHANKAAAHGSVELVGIADPNDAARKKIAEKHRIKTFASFDDMLPLTDAVIIAAPTFLHYGLGSACLAAGKHVLMEKPMTGSLADGRKLVELAQKRNLVLQAGHVEEFNPAWIAAKNAIRSDLMNGSPLLVDAVRTSGYTFRSTDIGAVFDMMVHDIDLVLSLAAAHVHAVDAIGFHILGGQNEDAAHARLRFDNGCVANLFASRVAEKPERKMRITTATATVNIDFAARTTSCYRADETVRQGRFAPNRILPDSVPLIAPTFMNDAFHSETAVHEEVDALAAELDDFVCSIASGKSPRVSGCRALEAVSVAETIVKSISCVVPQPIRRAA